MKELSIEEKAKRYDEVLKAAVVAHKDEDRHLKATLERIFPELKESEGERIRKEIQSAIEQLDKDSTICGKKYDYNQWIAWFKKQGEHTNFLNKIQIGDKVTRNEDGMLVNLSQLKRVAKKDEKQGEQKPNPVLDIEIPFGAKDSELQEASYYIPEGFHAEIESNRVVIKRGEQKPAWSEEDEDYYDTIIAKLEVTQDDALLTDNQMGFLKSLKDRVKPQPKQEWSEEDENELAILIGYIKSGEWSTAHISRALGIIDSIINKMNVEKI